MHDLLQVLQQVDYSVLSVLHGISMRCVGGGKQAVS